VFKQPCTEVGIGTFTSTEVARRREEKVGLALRSGKLEEEGDDLVIRGHALGPRGIDRGGSGSLEAGELAVVVAQSLGFEFRHRLHGPSSSALNHRRLDRVGGPPRSRIDFSVQPMSVRRERTAAFASASSSPPSSR
jgi:hypothetical protein